MKHGSYNQSSGQTNWIKSNWADIANGKTEEGAWFDPAGIDKYFDGQ